MVLPMESIHEEAAVFEVMWFAVHNIVMKIAGTVINDAAWS